MIVNNALILKLEKLARLKLSPQEREKLSGDLEKILKMVEKLEEVDTEGVEPLVYLTEDPISEREDVVQGQLEREKALQNAPKQDGTYFRVPKVLDR